jgi:uncharacterized protein (UPF0548 family)
VLFATRPPDQRVRAIIERLRQVPFSYPEVGASRTAAPAGYPVNHHRVCLGTGRALYERATGAIRQWKMYEMGWAELCWPDARIAPGAMAAVRARHFGFWSVNPIRVVYVLEESGEVERLGFAIGTLPGHSEHGEERFTVEYHHSDERVWYEVFAFAKGQHPLARLAPPLVKLVQRRFGRQSAEAMKRAVAQPR